MSAVKRLVLGVDGGGSKTQALLADQDGYILGRGSSGPSNFYTAGMLVSQQAVLDAVTAAFQQAGLVQTKVAVMCLGLGGVDRIEERTQVTTWLNEQGLAEYAYVDNDVFLLLWCGGMQGWGAGLIAGTGSIAVGRNQNGETVRAGGWGHIIGDEGSGYAIGLAALQAAACCADGRGEYTRLLDDILRSWSLSKPSDLIPVIYGTVENRITKIAHLAELVKVAAETGDPVAIRIESQAADDLAIALQAVIAQLGIVGSVPTAFGGSVLVHNQRIASVVREKLAINGIRLEPMITAACPAEGAVSMALNYLKAV